MTEKLGLAFSGGGFRASFYHIGVLAQMAEQGLLRHVEVISTVSGGSIIGALYYLHLKKLLEEKTDAVITDLDYVKIVQDIERDFLAATQTNIRMQTFSSFKANLKMTSASYSRSDRLAELYNHHLYQSVLPASSDVSSPVQMQELKIYPDGDKNFIPWEGNTNRKAKVPILVLNATTLNTGRNWQFTARTMGEPPERNDDESQNTDKEDDSVDKKTIRLRRPVSYANITAADNSEGTNLRNLPLGHAVAASACVPGLFPPLSITGLYQDSDAKETITPQLVDGGVFDNQAIEGLLQNECNCFVISDAAGQMGVENEVSTGSISVLLRVSGILQDRVRSESLKHLLTRMGKGKVAFVDLRRGLGIKEVAPAATDEHGKPEADNWIAPYSKKFNVDVKVQEKLSLMRTDLDAFTEVEAYSLMMDGYNMTANELVDLDFAQHHQVINKATWKFTEIAPWMAKPTEVYLQQLEIAKLVPLKALKVLPVKLGVPLGSVIAGLAYGFHTQLSTLVFDEIPVYSMLILFALGGLSMAAPKLAKAFNSLEYLRPHAVLAKRVAEVAWLMGGTLFVKFYLQFINPMFLAEGSLEALKKKSPHS